MKATQKKVDDLNLTVTISLDKSDWEEPRKKKLNEFRRSADLKGFRRGMAPASLIERLYGKQALGETVNKLVADKLDDFITSKKLNILGEPLPSEKEDKNDWENPDKFSFSFDMAIAPELNVTVSAEDNIPYYTVKATPEAVANYKEGLLKQYGQLASADEAKEDDFIIADFEADGQKIEGSYVALRSITDAEVKKSFVGLKKDAEMTVDIAKTFTNETDRAAMFKVKKEELAGLPAEWKMTVKDVKTFVNAPMEQATFDQIFGEGVCKDEADFNQKVEERLQADYSQESDYRFMLDAKEFYISKAAVELPDAFMKRWLLAANEGKFTMEDIEKEYDLFAKDFRWNMVRGKIMKDNDLKVEKDDIMKQAKSLVAYQYAMYGMQNVPDQFLEEGAKKVLEDRQQADRIIEKVEDDVALTFVRRNATIENKEITLEELHELTK